MDTLLTAPDIWRLFGMLLVLRFSWVVFLPRVAVKVDVIDRIGRCGNASAGSSCILSS